MNPTRFLRFEVMESRIALSANASSLLADPQIEITANGLDSQRTQEILEQLTKSAEDLSVSQPTTPPSNELGDSPIVQFRVDIRDLENRPVDAIQAGGEYIARVFVQDMRDLASANAAGSRTAGLYQVWVDLEFSENLHPTGSIRMSEAFTIGELDPKIDGAFLRNLGGIANNGAAFGGAEQFLLEAPFVVGSMDAPNRIQVVPSTSERDPVLLFGSFAAVPSPKITSPALDLPSATNDNSNSSTRPPLIDSSDDVSVKFPLPMHHAVALPNSADSPHDTASEDDSVALVSYIPFFRDGDSDSDWKWRNEDDWWRPNRHEDKKSHSDDWNELEWPDEDGQLLDAKSVQRGDSSATDETERDEKEGAENRGKRQSKHAGLFYDEALFLEGALVETFQSTFRLHLQVIAPQRHAHQDSAEAIASKKNTSQREGFIDIAEILNPHQHSNPWRDSVDQAIVGHQQSPSPEYNGPTIDWGTIEPLPINTAAQQQVQQVDANPKPLDQRTPLAMSQSISNSPETELPPTVQ